MESLNKLTIEELVAYEKSISIVRKLRENELAIAKIANQDENGNPPQKVIDLVKKTNLLNIAYLAVLNEMEERIIGITQ